MSSSPSPRSVPSPPAGPSPRSWGSFFRWTVRFVGLAMLLASLVPFWEALRALDHGDTVSSLLAGFVGWFVCQAGIELVRPESAE